jgi:hypothetical protein
MKMMLLAATAIVSLSTAAMADPVKLSSDRLGDVSGGFLLPNVNTTLNLAQTEVYSVNSLSNQDTALAVGIASAGVGAGNTSWLSGVNTTAIGGGM